MSESPQNENNDVFILIDENQLSSCFALKSGANCIAKNLGNNPFIKHITILGKKMDEEKLNKLARFQVYNFISIEDSFDIMENYVDCIWLNPALAKKLVDSLNCVEWDQFVKNNRLN